MMAQLQHILCIDDEDDILEITRLCLETVGEFQVTTCRNGREGISQARALIPDLILIDVMMPDIDGPSTFKILQDDIKLKEIPAIFMTARAQKSEIDEYLKAGAAGVITKPFDPMTLSDEIKSIWSKYHG